MVEIMGIEPTGLATVTKYSRTKHSTRGGIRKMQSEPFGASRTGVGKPTRTCQRIVFPV